MQGDVRLREQLEQLRMQGMRHRLELALVREELRQDAAKMPRGAAIALGILRSLAPASRSAGLGMAIHYLLGNARWIVPIASGLLLRRRGRRAVRGLRLAFAVATLGVVLLRLLRMKRQSSS